LTDLVLLALLGQFVHILGGVLVGELVDSGSLFYCFHEVLVKQQLFCIFEVLEVEDAGGVDVE
jgi:hypothetical protein